MREAQALELRERLEEVVRQQVEDLGALLELGAHAVRPVVDGLVAAPQDAVVGGQPVVVEAVARVGHALAPVPADRRPPDRIERLAHEDVVVDRDHVAADRAHQWLEGVRGEHDPGCAHPPGWRLEDDAVPVAPHRGGPRALMDAHAVLERRGAEAPGQSPRVHERTAALARVQACQVGRRVHLRAHLGTIEQLDLVAVAARDLGSLGQPLDFVLAGGNVDEAVLLPGGVDAAGAERLADRPEVLVPELDEPVHLIRPAREPVVVPVRERRVEKAAVAPARSPAAAVALEQDHLLVRSREQGRPQAGEAAADDREVTARLALEWRQGIGGVGRVEPEDALLGVAEGSAQPRSH